MKYRFALRVAVILLLLPAARSLAALPADDAHRDLGGDTWRIFADKCAECHDLSSPGKKSKFRYILDLPRLAANSRLLVRSEPDKSKLWRLVRDGEMPPDDAKAGPLSAAQKQMIHDWIAAGAPAPSGWSPRPAIPLDAVDGPSLPVQGLHWLGKFHVLVIHFPIALLAAAAMAESLAIIRRSGQPSPVVRFCVVLAGVGAVLAAALGWSRVSFGGYDAGPAGTLRLHIWLGTAASLVALAVLAVGERDARRNVRTLGFQAALFGGALLVGIAAHFGGSLVHGADYFNW